jgi:hypothetical protein
VSIGGGIGFIRCGSFGVDGVGSGGIKDELVGDVWRLCRSMAEMEK